MDDRLPQILPSTGAESPNIKLVQRACVSGAAGNTGQSPSYIAM